MFLFIVCPCASKKNGTHNANGSVWSTATSYAVVLLFVFNFCLLELEIGHPRPPANLIMTPEWLLNSGCTAKLASMYHLMVLIPFYALKDNVLPFVLFKYFIILTNLLKSFSVGFVTLMHSTDTVGWISDLARLQKNNAFAVVLWNNSHSSVSKCCLLYTSDAADE